MNPISLFTASRFTASRKSCMMLITIFLFQLPVFAQCPASISITSNAVITATCPSNGGFAINATAGTGAIYQITSGPAGFPAGIQSSNTFSGLLPGSYTVKVACAADPSVFVNTNITIPSSYVQVAANSVASNICTGSTPGGTISTTVTAGSSATYSYAYWIGDPAQADVTLTYQVNNSAALTNAFTAPTFGTYNVRVKDACGVFVTQQVTITRTFPENLCLTQIKPDYTKLTCAQLADSINLIWWLSSNPDALPAQGFDVSIYKNTSNCSSPARGAFVKTIHFDNTIPGYPFPLITVPRYTNLLLVLKTPCGDSCTYCGDYDESLLTMTLNSSVVSSGCVAAGDPLTYAIHIDDGINYVLPETIVIKNSAGADIPGSPYIAATKADLVHTFEGLPADNYTLDATDACGHSLHYVLTPGTGARNDLSVTFLGNETGCATIEGRTTVLVGVTGVMANFINAVATIIAPSPNLVGVPGERIHGGAFWEWSNAIPGATYFIEVSNGCGDKDTVNITVPLNATILNQHTNVTVEQLCGGGLGNIAVEAAYNGYGVFSYDIKNSANVIVGSGTAPGAVYSNLPAGTYTVTSKVVNCTNLPYTYSSSVTINPSGSGPIITKKNGITCEDASGNPTLFGSALFSFSGAAPLQVDYKLSSASDAAYVNLTNNATSSATITGLIADSSYTVRITDNCGNSSISQTAIGMLAPVKTENNLQPCTGDPYVLSVPDLINATYSWKKDGVSISSQRSVSFNSFSSGDNGTYVCTIVVAGCVTRIVTATLNSLLCGSLVTLPLKLASFTVKALNCATTLNWKTTTGAGAVHFTVQRAADGKNFTPLANITSATNDYSYTDNTPLQNSCYYRLRAINPDGHVSYSNAIECHSICNSIKTQWSVYPTLVETGNSVKLQLNTADAGLTTASIVVISITGQRAFAYDVQVHQGQNNYALPDKKLLPGTYLLCVYDKNLLRIGGIQKLVYR